MIYFTSNTFFNYNKAITFYQRNFNTLNDMNSFIMKKWNIVANENDIIYHLGNFGDYNYIENLKGKIILIVGEKEKEDIKNNYKDFYEFKNHLINIGFFDVKYEDYIDGFCLSHNKKEFIFDQLNIFGSVNNYQKIKENTINVSIDMYNYRLVNLNTILILQEKIDDNLLNKYDYNLDYVKELNKITRKNKQKSKNNKKLHKEIDAFDEKFLKNCSKNIKKKYDKKDKNSTEVVKINKNMTPQNISYNKNDIIDENNPLNINKKKEISKENVNKKEYKNNSKEEKIVNISNNNNVKNDINKAKEEFVFNQKRKELELELENESSIIRDLIDLDLYTENKLKELKRNKK